MQCGSLALVSRKEGLRSGSFVGPRRICIGVRVQRKRVIGTVGGYADKAAAHTAVAVLSAELNSEKAGIGSGSNYSHAALRSLRATGTIKGQYLAQPRYQENVPGVLGHKAARKRAFLDPRLFHEN
jgi:hypothetical protein